MCVVDDEDGQSAGIVKPARPRDLPMYARLNVMGLVGLVALWMVFLGDLPVELALLAGW